MLPALLLFPPPLPPVASGAAADVLTLAGGGLAVLEPLPPAMGAAWPVPFCAMAAAWNCACVFSAVGFREKAMPLPQWPFCLQ